MKGLSFCRSTFVKCAQAAICDGWKVEIVSWRNSLSARFSNMKIRPTIRLLDDHAHHFLSVGGELLHPPVSAVPALGTGAGSSTPSSVLQSLGQSLLAPPPPSAKHVLTLEKVFDRCEDIVRKSYPHRGGIYAACIPSVYQKVFGEPWPTYFGDQKYKVKALMANLMTTRDTVTYCEVKGHPYYKIAGKK
jgi:hypothetical protein